MLTYFYTWMCASITLCIQNFTHFTTSIKLEQGTIEQGSVDDMSLLNVPRGKL